ncbi:hypothetical protein [Aeromicrobium sp. REDSEA-S32_B7]|uniref:hypothetical protein n=1 Tax=Aeromicrobium sp. REDSEA-S32_B7 TaxID=1811526 RepID=UPI000AD884DB|nr:hypothetical protein [Aeromicrobium sp. REDSEA-S32_B7]
MTSWLAALVTWCSTLLGTGDADLACLERPTRAVGPQQAYRLPSDQPTRRRVLLTWTADGWRIGATR